MGMAASFFASPVVAGRYDRTSSVTQVGDFGGKNNREFSEYPRPENIGPGIRDGDSDLRLHRYPDLHGPSNVFRVLRGPTLKRVGSPEPLIRRQQGAASL